MSRVLRISTLLLTLLALSAGCVRNEPQPVDPTEGSIAVSQTGESETDVEPFVPSGTDGFTMEDLTRENAVSTLVFAYRNVQMLRYENDMLWSETYYFDHGGEPVWTRRTVDPDMEESYSCGVRNVGYYKVGDHLQFSYFLEEDSDLQQEHDFEYDVSEQLLYGTIGNIESAGEDLWRFEIRDAEYSPEIVCRCTATKQTLTLKTIEWDYGDGSISRVVLNHGDAIRTKDFGLLDGFDKPLRTVKCVCTLHDENGDPTMTTYPIDVPYNVEPLWVHSRGLSVYLDKGLTKEYEYPGNGIGYIVYATDAMG